MLYSQCIALTLKKSEICYVHYYDVIMSAMASQITSLTIVYSTIYSGADKRKHQSSASLAFGRKIHLVNSPHKGPVTRKIFPFDDVIMNLMLKASQLLTPPSDTVLITYHRHVLYHVGVNDIYSYVACLHRWLVTNVTKIITLYLLNLIDNLWNMLAFAIIDTEKLQAVVMQSLRRLQF